ncbi:hypothetical protein ACGTJS_00565 [Faucicola mancuniensis]|uniref:hypothetical protein n=1 Tax=Faucicola mancuniensis TaxID=1309795 RepID=UPI0028F05649|nr:hypothetical protein [uncultured Moraxella sp.]
MQILLDVNPTTYQAFQALNIDEKQSVKQIFDNLVNTIFLSKQQAKTTTIEDSFGILTANKSLSLEEMDNVIAKAGAGL